MTSVRFIESGLDDPDRQAALRITNYVGRLPLKRAVAIYALAIGMSFRGLGFLNQTSVLWSICEACRQTWARDGAEPTGVCETCGGAGTVKADGSAIRHEQVPPDELQACVAEAERRGRHKGNITGPSHAADLASARRAVAQGDYSKALRLLDGVINDLLSSDLRGNDYLVDALRSSMSVRL